MSKVLASAALKLLVGQNLTLSKIEEEVFREVADVSVGGRRLQALNILAEMIGEAFEDQFGEVGQLFPYEAADEADLAAATAALEEAQRLGTVPFKKLSSLLTEGETPVEPTENSEPPAAPIAKPAVTATPRKKPGPKPKPAKE